jgi:hypothetical protein
MIFGLSGAFCVVEALQQRSLHGSDEQQLRPFRPFFEVGYVPCSLSQRDRGTPNVPSVVPLDLEPEEPDQRSRFPACLGR